MKKLKIVIALTAILYLGACTDLEETLYDRIDAGSFFQNEEEITAGLTNVYYQLMISDDWWFPYILQEVSTDHGEVPTRNNGGWYNGGIFITATTHTWDATHAIVANLYRLLYILGYF